MSLSWEVLGKLHSPKPPVEWDLYGYLTSTPEYFYNQVYLSYALLGELATQPYFRGFVG